MCVESEMDNRVGFRFKPKDEEIIRLLKEKRRDPDFSVPSVKDIHIYNFDPWDLPGFSEIPGEEEVRYFYCEPYYKYAKSKRAHRRTKTGYWKMTGKGSKMKTKNGHEVIGNKKILTFCGDSPAFEQANTKWAMHEISVEDDPAYKKDFVVCRLERKRDSKLGISTSEEDQSGQDFCFNIDVTKNICLESSLPSPDQNMVSNYVAENIGVDYEVLASDLISYFRDPVAEDTSLEFILPPNQHLFSDRNNVAENTTLASQVLPSDHLISYSRNHVAENTCAESQVLPSHGYHAVEITVAESQLLASQNLASHSRNHVAENPSPESQQLANPNSISYFRNHVEENSSTDLHPIPNGNLGSPILPNQHSVFYSTNFVEYTFEPQLLGEFNPEQEPSNSNGFSCGFDLLNSQFNSEQVDDLINSLRAFQNESSCEEPGQTFTPDLKSSTSDENSPEATEQTYSPDFNSSMSDGGVYMENSSDMDIETLNEMVNELYNSPYYFSIMC